MVDYIVEYKIASDSSYIVYEVTQNTSTVFIHLESGTTYDVRVRAAVEAGQFDYLAATIQMTPLVFESQEVLSVIGLSENSLTLQWKAVKGATQYALKVHHNVSEAAVYTVQGVESTTWTVEPLNTGIEYTVYVIGGTATADMPWTMAMTAVQRPLASVANLTVENCTNTSVDVTWIRSAGTTEFQAAHVVSYKTFHLIDDTGIVEEHYRFTDLVPEKDWSFKIFSGHLALYERESSASGVIGSTLSQVQDVHVISMTDTSVDIAWIATSISTRYLVTWRTNTSGIVFGSFTLEDGSTNTTITSLTKGVTYIVTVFAGGTTFLRPRGLRCSLRLVTHQSKLSMT